MFKGYSPKSNVRNIGNRQQLRQQAFLGNRPKRHPFSECSIGDLGPRQATERADHKHTFQKVPRDSAHRADEVPPEYCK